MIQKHSIILWRKAEKADKSFEEIAEETYKVLNLFQNHPQEMRPNFLTGRTKKDVKEFKWNYENFCNILKKGINKEGEKIFEDLGYSLSFFSSMDEKESYAFQIETGNKNEKFYNTLIINLPLSLNLFDKENSEKMIELFEELVMIYRPFWGCVSNSALSRKYGKFLDGGLPTTVHWMNYWSEDIIETIGMKKIQKIVDGNSMISFQDGIMLIKDTALDIDKEEDFIFHEELHKRLFM